MAVSLVGVSDPGQRGGGHGPMAPPLNTLVLAYVLFFASSQFALYMVLETHNYISLIPGTCAFIKRKGIIHYLVQELLFRGNDY